MAALRGMGEVRRQSRRTWLYFIRQGIGQGDGWAREGIGCRGLQDGLRRGGRIGLSG